MRLSCKPLKNLVNINIFEHSDALYGREEQTNVFHVMLFDLDRNLRYITPSLPADMSLKAYFTSIDGSQVYEITGVLVNNDDKSIFSFTLTPEQVIASGAVKFSFTEGAASYKFMVSQCVSFELLNTFGAC